MIPKQEQRMSLAEEALEKTDAAALKRLYDQAEKDVATLVDGMSVMVKHDKLGPRPEGPSDDAVKAMRDVAMAAIELAREVSKSS